MIGIYSGEWGLVIDSFGADGTRPTTTPGTSVTPGNNTYSAYVQLLAATSDDGYGILINVNGVSVSAAATDTLITVGVDNAGGTAYQDVATDLICSAACPYANGAAGGVLAPGVSYYFPLFVKAGSTVAVKATQNNAAPAAIKVQVKLFCRPSRPGTIRVGQKIVTYGSTPATSTGTAITAGTTSDGTYAQVGTIAAGDRPWFWQVGIGINNAAVSASGVMHVDLAIGQSGNKKQAIQNNPVGLNTTEQLSMGVPADGFCDGAPGELVYVRAQSSAGAQTGLSAVAYGVI